LCVPGATGPEDCGLVYLVMKDPDLVERWAELRREAVAGTPIVTKTGARDPRLA
jgi:hypothetical protein